MQQNMNKLSFNRYLFYQFMTVTSVPHCLFVSAGQMAQSLSKNCKAIQNI